MPRISEPEYGPLPAGRRAAGRTARYPGGPRAKPRYNKSLSGVGA